MGIRAYKPYYKRTYEISKHAVDRFRERVDAEFQARPQEDLSNLLDERIRHSTDRFPIKDFTKRSVREGRVDKFVVRLDNLDGTHCFALLEDENVVVTILTSQMVDKNLTDGSWEHVSPVPPAVNSPFAALAKIIIPTSDATVKRRTGVADVTDQIPEPELVERDRPIEEHVPQVPIQELTPATNVIEEPVMTEPQTQSPKQGIAELAVALEEASKDVTTWSIAVQEAKRSLDAAMAKFVTVRDDLNAAIMTLAGVPGVAMAQIAATTAKPKVKPEKEKEKGKGDHLFKSPYTDEQKAQFVELVRNGRTMWNVSQEFDVAYTTIRKWCTDAGIVAK